MDIISLRALKDLGYWGEAADSVSYIQFIVHPCCWRRLSVGVMMNSAVKEKKGTLVPRSALHITSISLLTQVREHVIPPMHICTSPHVL